MKVEKDKVVIITYSLSTINNQILEVRTSDNPVEFIVGHGQILPSLEKLLIGEVEGFTGQFILAPSEAHGEYDKSLVLEMTLDEFPQNIELKKGMKFESRDKKGQSLALHIVDIDNEKEKILVDGNHPLAGQTLSFDVKILEVRNAAKEEIFQGRTLSQLEPKNSTLH